MNTNNQLSIQYSSARQYFQLNLINWDVVNLIRCVCFNFLELLFSEGFIENRKTSYESDTHSF